MAEQLTANDIEFIHDVLVGALLPFDEHVGPAEYRNRNYIEAAAARPFQTVFGEEAWPSLHEKAAVLFHSLICNHCFLNGNKRTAVIGLDMFLARNHHVLLMTQDKVYELAKITAKANQEGRPTDSVLQDLAETIRSIAVDMKIVDDPELEMKLSANKGVSPFSFKMLLSLAQSSLQKPQV